MFVPIFLIPCFERYISYLEDFALFSQPKLIGGAKHVPLFAGNVVRSKLIFFQFSL